MKYFKFEEFVESEVAQTYGIDNTPDDDAKENILELADIMDRIREGWTAYCDKKSYGSPALIISSAYRCPELNEKIGGAKKSAHQKGSACDIQPANDETQELFMFMQRWLFAHNVQYDELIIEKTKNTQWVHFAKKSYSGEYRHKIAELRK